MKKIVLCLLIAATLALTIGQVAFAQTCEDEICQFVKQNEKVIDAKCIVYQRCCVIAIKTEKFTTKSQYTEFLDKISAKIKTDYQVDNVFVTRNPKVMKQIENLANLDETQRENAIAKIVDDVLHHRPAPKFVLPGSTGGVRLGAQSVR